MLNKLPRKNYPEELRLYVWKRYCQRAKSQDIYAEIMERWPDCGMNSFRGVCMMIGPLKVRYGQTGVKRCGHFRSKPERAPAPKAVPSEPIPPGHITLCGPAWSRPVTLLSREEK